MENAKLSGPPDFGAAAGKYDYMKSKTTEELLDELIEKIMRLNAGEFDEFCEIGKTLGALGAPEVSETGGAA